MTGGYNASIAVLETGETWGIYTLGNSLVGAVYANTTSSGSTVSGSGSFFNFVSRTSGSSTFTGTTTQKNVLGLTFNDGTKFNGTYGTTYDQPASLASLAGNYVGYAVTGITLTQTLPVTISANGNVSATSIVGNLSCVTSGTATPRASGKNIFDVQLTFTGPGCALGTGTVVKGMAYFDLVSKAVGVIALNSSKTDGLVFVGTK